MKTAEELYQQFFSRYEGIIRGGITGEMERLGTMTQRVMQWLCTYEPGLAAQAIAILDGEDSQQCHNYLSGHEASEIVRQMDPQPQWSPRQVLDMLKSAGYATEEMPYYNSYALATTMCMILSDSGETLKEELGSDIRPAKADEILRLVYKLAVDKLKDKDGKFNIRKYFDL
jgi:hypothetical protein